MQRLFEFIDNQKEQTGRFLFELIRYESTQGNEASIQDYLRSEFEVLGITANLHPIKDSIKDDPEYTFMDEEVDYRDRSNLVIRTPGRDKGRSLILNCHSDVVPGGNWDEAFKPFITNDVVTGRGACDDKGQIAVLYLICAALRKYNVQLKGDLIGQIVIEEETGGNGTLALLREGLEADGVIVLEPTGLKIHPACRGVLWFRITVDGWATHMGRKHEGVSAIDEMIEVIRILHEYEKMLQEQSQHKLFVRHPSPVQLNVGMIKGGDFPSMVPNRAMIEGGVGFLPDKNLSQIKKELVDFLMSRANNWIKENCQIEFSKLHNDAFETPVNHPLVTALQKSCRECGQKEEVSGWSASCDARLFHTVGRMATVVFGPGDFGKAHSNQEQVNIPEILTAAKILTRMVIEWCGSG